MLMSSCLLLLFISDCGPVVYQIVCNTLTHHLLIFGQTICLFPKFLRNTGICSHMGDSRETTKPYGTKDLMVKYAMNPTNYTIY